MSMKEVFLEGCPPWGFRMNGGADAGHPLRISRVNPGSKAETKGVREGNLISSINGQPTKCLTNSESHALLRTVKENLRLGLNEDKNSSPRRRSREIKSVSVSSVEKDRSESPASTKGSKRPSSNQLRHQRRTRLKHRIKEMFGLKSKDSKKQKHGKEDEEEWEIVEVTDLRRQSSSIPRETVEEHEEISRSSSLPPRYEYDKKVDDTVNETGQVGESPDILLSLNETKQSISLENVVHSAESKEEQVSVEQLDSDNGNCNETQAVEIVICSPEEIVEPEEEGEEIAEESLQYLPANDLLEVCNATIMIEDEELTVDDLHTPLITQEDERQLRGFLGTLNLNSPDYEPIEVQNQTIIYPSYSSTLSYFFPQRRYLEVITEENSDLSDVDKPWENSELIRQNNNVEKIPDDWYGSQDGIDTSWRDGRSLEDMSDIPIISDSHSDSDLLSDDIKLKKKAEEIWQKRSSENEPSTTTGRFRITLDNSSGNVSKSYNENKSIPSPIVVKNVVSSYVNQGPVIEKINIDTAQATNLEFNTTLVQQPITADIELVFIDSSDSDAYSLRNSISSRTSLSMEKDDEEPEYEPFEENCSSTGHLIKEVLTDINETVKEMSSMSFECKTKPFKYSSNNINDDEKIDPKRRFSYPFYDFDCKNIENVKESLILSVTEENSNLEMIDTKRNVKVQSLKELCENIVIGLPSSSILKALSVLNKQQYVAKTSSEIKQLNNQSRKESVTTQSSNDRKCQSNESIFGDVSESSITSDLFVQEEGWVGVQLPQDPGITVCFSPSQSKILSQSPIEASDLLDLHIKFTERRGYHEEKKVVKPLCEPDIISLSKTRGKDTSYTPELLAQAANLLALHNYHESRQQKMKKNVEKDDGKFGLSKSLTDVTATEKRTINTSSLSDPETEKIEKNKKNYYDAQKRSDSLKCNNGNGSETIGRSRLLDLFQKMELKSSSGDPMSRDSGSSDSNVYHQESLDLSDNQNQTLTSHICEEDSQSRNRSSSNPDISSSCENIKDKNRQLTSSNPEISSHLLKESDKDIRPKSLSGGDIFRQQMYQEYMNKIGELSERRNLKIIKFKKNLNYTSTVRCSCEIVQPLESEFMSKLKERNEKLGIKIDDQVSTITDNGNETYLPKHMKELMEITEECGDDVVGKDGLLVEIDEALSPERQGFLTAKGVWSPIQTPEAERKRFDFNVNKEEESRQRQERGPAEENQPPVWTPRSAGPSPTLGRKFRSVNFQSPPTSPTKETLPHHSLNETPELPKELPIETSNSDSKSRLITSSSENSTLSSLKLPLAQNPTITLLQKAREGHIPKGAQYLDEPTSPVSPNEIIYTVKKGYTDDTRKIVELGPRKFEGIGPTTKEGIPIVLRSEVKEDNQQKWYKRMYDSLHKAEHDKDFVTVKYKTKRRGLYPHSYSGGYASEPERLGYDSDASLAKYATLDRRRIKNKENDFTTSTMPRNRYAPGVRCAVDVYKNQPGRIEDYEPGHSSIAEKETKQWWDEVMDIFEEELNDHSKSNQYSSAVSGKPYTYSLKDAGYESDSTLVFKRRGDHSMSGQLLSPAEQKMAYKVIQRGGEVPLQGLRKAAPQRPKEDSEIEYFPLSPTLTRIRVHKKTSKPKERVFYPVSEVSGEESVYPSYRRPRRTVPSPPRRQSSRCNPTLKYYTQPESKVEYLKEKLITKMPEKENVGKTLGKAKIPPPPKFDPARSQYGVIRSKKEMLRKSPELKAPAEVKKVLKENRTPSGTVVKSSTTLYSSSRNKKTKDDKSLKVTVAISSKGKELLTASTTTSAKTDSRKSSPLLNKIVNLKPKMSPDSKRISLSALKTQRPSSRSSMTSSLVSSPDQLKKVKKESPMEKKKRDKKPDLITTKSVDKVKEDDKKNKKRKQDNGKKKNNSKKKDKENVPENVKAPADEAMEDEERKESIDVPRQQDFFQKLLLREPNSPCSSIVSSVYRTPSVLERAKKFIEPPDSCYKSEPSLRNLNIYLSQKKPVSESRFRSLDRNCNRVSPFYGTFDFYDKLDRFDRHNNVWDYGSCRGTPTYESVKGRSSSEPPHTSPMSSPDVEEEVRSPSVSRSPSCRRIRKSTSRAIETISGVRRKGRSKSLNEADRSSQIGSTSSLSWSQMADHDEYKTYVMELLHSTKKSERFKELHKFYSSLERMAELEKTASNTDLRPRLKGEEVIDFDRWKQLRTKEKAEKELTTLYEKLKGEQKEKGFFFESRETVRWCGDSGLRHKEKSVEDLRLQYQRMVERDRSPSDRKESDQSKDMYKPLWRGNSVANLASSLTSITGSKRGRPVKESYQSLVKPAVKKDRDIGSRLWSSLSMEQVNALKNQLSEIYSTVSNLKHERIKKMRKNIEDYEINVSELSSRGNSPLHVRCNSLVDSRQLYSPAVKKKDLRRQECMKSDSISTLPHWKSPKPLSETEKRRLSMSLSAEVKERIKKKKHGSLVIPRETLGAVAAIKGSKKLKSPSTSETSPRTCYSLLSDESIDKSDERNKDFLLVLAPKDQKEDIKKMVNDWGSKEYARIIQTTSSSSSSVSTVIHLGGKDEYKASTSKLCDLSQSSIDVQNDFDYREPPRGPLSHSQSFSDLKELYGEKQATTFATLPLRHIQKPFYSSTDSLYKSISPDPMKYYRAYLNVVKAGDVRKLKDKFESYDDLYNLKRERSRSPVCKRFQSDPDLTRDYLSRKGGELNKVIVKGQEIGDVQLLRKKYEKVSPVPFRIEDRFMPRINVISKTASLQRRASTPPPQGRGRSDRSRGTVERLRQQFEDEGMSLLGQMYTSTPEMRELRDIAPYLECEWTAHQHPGRSVARRRRPASSSPLRQSILKTAPGSGLPWADQEFNPELHRPVCRYQPPQWHHPRPTVTFKEPFGNPIPTPPRDITSRQRTQESPHRYVESEVNIHYRSPVRSENKAPGWPEEELAARQAEMMRRIYQEQRRTKYLTELHDMYSRRHTDNLLPSQKSPIPLNRYDDFPVDASPPRPRDRTPEPKLVARALYNFVGQTSRELSFRRGDIIYVRRQIDKNWYEGEHNAMIGLFPFNYVEIIPYDGIRTLPKKANEGQARAKFSFQAQSHLELSLVKGELVLLTRRVDDNWFEGRVGNRKGIFPVSYVEVLVEPGERATSPRGATTPTKPLVAPASHSVMLNGAKDLGQQHYQPPRPTLYSTASLPSKSKMNDISLVNQTLHIDTQSEPIPYRVLYTYRPQNDDELELKEGDVVYVMEKCDDGWYVGSLHRNGQFGTFPGNYVERIQ